MTFTSPSFLLLFFPAAVIFFFLSDKRYRPYFLLFASGLFYVFNNPLFLPILIVVTWLNFILGKDLGQQREDEKRNKRTLILGVLLNVLMLVFYKFSELMLGDYALFILPSSAPSFFSHIMLPLGFSYIAFQNIAYLYDVHNEVNEAEMRFWDYALYTLFFPKVLVGPIMRYRMMKADLKNPTPNIENAAKGIRRMIIGLAKKVLIADIIARAINPSFELATPNFSSGIAWFMLIGYAVQLYYDFSGLTDMALGMGQIFGFDLMENFNYPYIAQSISDFWRRWHISLSSWVRDYIFTPMEFKRRRVKFARQQTHILLAFLIMGLWHGLTPNFILWGLFNGIFLALEITFLSKALRKAWRPLRHLYAICVVLIGWAIFRTSNLTYAVHFLGRLVGTASSVTPLPFVLTNPLPIIDNTVWLAFIIGLIFSIPVVPEFIRKFISRKGPFIKSVFAPVFCDVILVLLFLLSLASIISTNAVGNIYGGF